MSKRIMCPWCGASNRDDRQICWACEHSLTDTPEPEVDNLSNENDLTEVEPVQQLTPDEEPDCVPPWLIRTVGSISDQKAPGPVPAFGSSCWLYGLWIVGISTMGQLGDAARSLRNDDAAAATTEVVVSFAFLALAAALQLSRARRTGKLGAWTWLNFLPACGVICFAIWMFATGGAMLSPPGVMTDGTPERVTTWESVPPMGIDCTVKMPGQPTETAPQTGLLRAVTSVKYTDSGDELLRSTQRTAIE